jgi:hypothetical protein
MPSWSPQRDCPGLQTPQHLSLDPLSECPKSRANQGFSHSDLFADQSNPRITKGACPWDIYTLPVADEMLKRQTEWPKTT